MLVLERKGNEVYCQGVKLRINPQASKGPNNEVVRIGDCEGSNGQKWMSLKKLQEGINEIECQGREVTSSKKYVLTQDEQDRVNELQKQIDEIIDAAKARYIEKPNLNANPATMSLEDRLALIEQIKKYYNV